MRKIDKLQFEIQKLKFSTEQSHPNKMQWEGIICLLDQPSDGTPGGADGLFVMTKKSVEASYETMNGMPLNCVWNDGWFSNPCWALTGHDTQFTIGYVTETWIDGNKLMAKGLIWRDNYPDVAFMITNASPALGFSVEATATSEQREDGNYYSKEVVFTGLATLWKASAAWGDTQLLSLVANRINTRNKLEDDNTMNKEELQALFADFTKGITDELTKVQASVDQKLNAFETKTEEAKKAEEALKIEAAKQAGIDELAKLKAANEELTAKLEAAAKVIPGPTAGQSAAPKDEVNYSDELNKINAMNSSNEDKAKLRFQLAFKAEK